MNNHTTKNRASYVPLLLLCLSILMLGVLSNTYMFPALPSASQTHQVDSYKTTPPTLDTPSTAKASAPAKPKAAHSTPSPIPISIIALLLIISAAAIRRHQKTSPPLSHPQGKHIS